MLTFKIQGEQRLQGIIDRLPAALDTVKILDEGAAVLYNRMRTRFLQQVDPLGNKWVPSKAAIKENRSTLFKTGKLFRSLQLYADSPNSRAIGTNVTNNKGFPYGIVHQFGTATVPQRMFLGFNEQEDVPYMSDLVIKRIQEAFQA